MLPKLRIIIVEDNGLIAMDLADLLIAMDHDVCAIASGENEAVQAAEVHQPDLMIVDGNLAQGDGVSAMQRILKHRYIPHLYISGNAHEIKDRVPGAVIICKPFIMKDLTQAIGIALAKPDVQDDASC